MRSKKVLFRVHDEELFFLFFRQRQNFVLLQTQHTKTTNVINSLCFIIIIIIMLRKGVNNSRSKLSLSVMKKDKSKNSTYILVNQVRSFHLRFCCVFFVFLSSLSSSRLMMMMRIGKATTGRVVLCSI